MEFTDTIFAYNIKWRSLDFMLCIFVPMCLCELKLCHFYWVYFIQEIPSILEKKMRNGPHINVIYHYVAYKNTYKKQF